MRFGRVFSATGVNISIPCPQSSSLHHQSLIQQPATHILRQVVIIIYAQIFSKEAKNNGNSRQTFVNTSKQISNAKTTKFNYAKCKQLRKHISNNR